jgi:plastocyanin
LRREQVRIHKAIALAAALVLAAMALSACGDDDGASDTSAATSTTAAATTSQAASSTAASSTTAAETTTTEATSTTQDDMGDGGDVQEIEVTIDSTAFDVEEIRVTAGQEVHIVVTDNDAGADEPHNFHVRAGSENYFTNIEPAPNVQELTFTIQEPGEYEFFCDTHLAEMSGTFIVEP